MTTATFNDLPPTFASRSADPARHETHARGAALAAILAKHDDRLLRDVGLTRADLVGPAATFWSEWRRTREPWNL